MYSVFPLGYFPAVVAGLFPMDHAPSPTQESPALRIEFILTKKDK